MPRRYMRMRLAPPFTSDFKVDIPEDPRMPPIPAGLMVPYEGTANALITRMVADASGLVHYVKEITIAENVLPHGEDK